jgi:hypothetical protein
VRIESESSALYLSFVCDFDSVGTVSGERLYRIGQAVPIEYSQFASSIQSQDFGLYM